MKLKLYMFPLECDEGKEILLVDKTLADFFNLEKVAENAPRVGAGNAGLASGIQLPVPISDS